MVLYFLKRSQYGSMHKRYFNTMGIVCLCVCVCLGWCVCEIEKELAMAVYWVYEAKLPFCRNKIK